MFVSFWNFSGLQETTIVTLCCPGFFQPPVYTTGQPITTKVGSLEKHGRIYHTIFIHFVSGILYFGIAKLLRMNWFNHVIKSATAEETDNFWIFIIVTYVIGAVLYAFLAMLYYKVCVTRLFFLIFCKICKQSRWYFSIGGIWFQNTVKSRVLTCVTN